MANQFRVDRVGMEIKREVNEILQKKVRDPRIQGITITDVQMLGDLSMAKVYYTLMSNLASEQEKAQTGLEKAKGTIKRELGHNLKMYKIPDLTFIKDESIEYGNKIDQMLRDLDQKYSVILAISIYLKRKEILFFFLFLIKMLKKACYFYTYPLK